MRAPATWLRHVPIGHNDGVELVDSLIRRADRVQRRNRALAFAVGVVKKFGDDRGGHLAALIAYYGFLAIFPLLLVFVTALGFVLDGDPALQRDLVDSALADFPVIGVQLRRNVHALSGQGVAFVIGLLVLVWGALGVANAAQHAIATVWSVPGRARGGFAPRIGRSLLLLVVLAFGVVVTTALAAAADAVGGSAAAALLSVAAALALNVGLYLLATRILAPASIVTSELGPGAVVGGIAWTVLQLLGTYLVARQLQHTTELYGFFAIVLGLLFWLMLAAQVFVYSAEVSVVRSRRLWPRALAPPPLTPADERTLADLARAEERRPEQHVDVRFD